MTKQRKTKAKTKGSAKPAGRLMDKLNDAMIRGHKAGDGKLFDGGGLFIETQASGSKLWRLKYRFGGVEKLLALGVFPIVTLKVARQKRDDARRLLDAGTDPGEQRKEIQRRETNGDTFAAVANQWFALNQSGWALTHAAAIRSRLDRDVIPRLGKKRIADIDAPLISELLKKIEARGVGETARRIRTIVQQVFRFAIANRIAKYNPVADVVVRDTLKPIAPRSMPAITEDPKELAALLNAIDDYKGSEITRLAFKLAPHVFVRPGELRQAGWSEINFERALWTIPSGRMKLTLRGKQDKERAHLVPLSRQALSILRELHELTGTGRYLFPCATTRERPMSENALTAALARMGYAGRMSWHGFRATASSALNDAGFNPDWIEAQLAHVRADVRSSYNRSVYIAQRTGMMQAWSDYLDRLKAGDMRALKA